MLGKLCKHNDKSNIVIFEKVVMVGDLEGFGIIVGYKHDDLSSNRKQNCLYFS